MWLFFALALLLACPTAPARAATATIILLTPLPHTIPLGESYTVEILVESDERFALAAVQAAPQFPAYLHDRGGDREQNATTTVLKLTLFGNRPTADLPGGATAGEVAVGVIYPGGERVVERFPFTIAVVE
jgi:hypothetical protein